ncbi:MAG: NosD domain-containing protein [Methanomassiliicoccus sp.]|nr:NosD domain-containing protein [Methanomassiliicoccus sp.]
MIGTASLAVLVSPTIDAATSSGAIRINGNADLMSQANAGGWRGDGSASNPYVISGLSISGVKGNGIYLGNTTLYVTISGCTVSGTSYVSDSYNVGAGIEISGASHVTITGNTISGTANDGILVAYGGYNSITGNNIAISGASTGMAIHLYSSNNNDISNNVISCSVSNGIYLVVASNNRISGNTVSITSSSGEGIHLCTSSNGNTISGNNITSLSVNGIYILKSSNSNVISGNTIHCTTSVGVYVNPSCVGNVVTGNIVNPSSSTDTTAPTLTITSPVSGSTTTATHPTISWTASDASGIAYFQIVRDGGSWVQLSSSQTSYTTVNSLAGGSHTVTVRAVDTVGNYKDATVVFSVSTASADTTAPSLMIVSPSNGATTTATHPTISWTASDASGIAYFQIVRDGGSWVQLSSSQTSYTTVNSLSQGGHTMTVRAVDNAGNYKDATVTFTVSIAAVDKTAPTLTITSPVSGSTTTATHPTISWTASDASGIAYYQIVRDGGSWVQLSSGQTSYTTVYSLVNGDHTVTVRAIDNAGNYTDATTTFTVMS